jgi:ATPase family associated with various cellular activities (AAA)
MSIAKGFQSALPAPVQRALNSLFRKTKRIDYRLRAFLEAYPEPAVLTRDFPYFAFADFSLALGRFVRDRAHETLPSYHDETLAALLFRKQPYYEDRTLNQAARLEWKIGFEEKEFFPRDCCWLIQMDEGEGEGRHRLVVRLWLNTETGKTTLEIAAGEFSVAEAALREIKADATAHSIYLGKTLEVAAAEAIAGEYGDEGVKDQIGLAFRRPERIGEGEILLEPEIRDLIQELIFDFDDVAGKLPFHNIARKRGVIFYGPPGTGKTHTTKFILSRLENRTKLVCSGKALANIRLVANVARLFSPSLVVLEDADLVFTDREINGDANNLGEFMDVLDGYSPGDDVIFVLSTNSLERVEDAIKHRPGRISQCIFMGPPGESLRERYIDTILALHHARLDGKDTLVRRTRGCSQAFLKELIQRMIQWELKASGPSEPDPILLSQATGLEILARMQASGHDRGRRRIGFDRP